MTAPPVKLPYLPQGNTLTDISQAAASLASGLNAEKAKRREDAMAEALLRLKEQQLQQPDYVHEVVQTPQGLRHAYRDRRTMRVTITDEQAPESQYFFPTEDPAGNLGIGRVPRYQPGQPATSVEMPPNVQPRDAAPTVLPIETPQGPGIARVPRRQGQAEIVTDGAGGAPIQPQARQFEVEKAQFAANMQRAATGMNQIADVNPAAIDNVVQRMNVQGVLQALPVIGAPLGEVVQRAMGLGLSEEEANWLANFYTFIGFAVPELAGKQMTITEMRQQIAMFVPLIGEPESARRIKRENVMFRVESAMRAAGSGMTRIGGAPVDSTVVQPTQQPRSRYGYTKPQPQ